MGNQISTRLEQKKAIMQNISYRVSISLLAIALGLAACGKLGEKKEASQVAAKVNGAEISVHQINQVLARTPGITNENADNARKEILERLIVQELAVSKATEAKLDRTPDVIMALDAAKREILARAYFNQLAGADSKVAEEEVKRYYADHPELFSQRKIFAIMDIAMRRDDKLIAPLQDLIARNKTMQEIARWLKETGVPFNASSDTRAAGQMPLEILPRIAKLKDGQIEIIETGPVLHVIHLVNSKLDPVTLAAASPQIQQFLGNQRAQEAVKKLRESAKVEYVGDFAQSKSPAEKSPAEKSPTPPQAAPSAAPDDSIVKGAKGPN